MSDYTLNFDSLEFTSYREAIRLGVIDNYRLYEDCFIGTSGNSECFVAAFSDSGIERAIALLSTEIEIEAKEESELQKNIETRFETELVTKPEVSRETEFIKDKTVNKTEKRSIGTERDFEINRGLKTGYPIYMFRVYMFRGTKLARAFLEAHKDMRYEGEGFFEYIYRGDKIPLSDNGCTLKVLDLSYFDVIKEHYRLADSDYIKDRLEHGVVDGLFDEKGRLVGFIGEHSEGAMGMLEIFPEFRKHGYGEYLECLRINKLLSVGRVPFCNVFYNNKASVALQEKIGLEKSSLDSWWVSLSL